MRIVLQLARLHERGASFRRRVLAKRYTLRREKLEPLFEVMDGIAKVHDATITQVALNWLIAANPRVIPIPGPQDVTQAADNLATLSWKLTREEFELLSRTEAASRWPRASREIRRYGRQPAVGRSVATAPGPG